MLRFVAFSQNMFKFATNQNERSMNSPSIFIERKTGRACITSKEIAKLLNRDPARLFYDIREFVDNSFLENEIDRDFLLCNFFNVARDQYNFAITIEGLFVLSRIFNVSDLTKIATAVSSRLNTLRPETVAPETTGNDSPAFDEDDTCLIATILNVAKILTQKEDKIIHDALKTLRFDPEKRDSTLQRFKRMIEKGETSKVLEESRSMIETATTPRKSTLF